MTEKDPNLRREADTLRTLRDELRVQLNLAGKEARDLFESAEKSWQKLEGRLRVVERESRTEIHSVGAAARALLEEIGRAYKRIRELL